MLSSVSFTHNTNNAVMNVTVITAKKKTIFGHLQQLTETQFKEISHKRK